MKWVTHSWALFVDAMHISSALLQLHIKSLFPNSDASLIIKYFPSIYDAKNSTAKVWCVQIHGRQKYPQELLLLPPSLCRYLRYSDKTLIIMLCVLNCISLSFWNMFFWAHTGGSAVAHGMRVLNKVLFHVLLCLNTHKFMLKTSISLWR